MRYLNLLIMILSPRLLILFSLGGLLLACTPAAPAEFETGPELTIYVTEEVAQPAGSSTPAVKNSTGVPLPTQSSLSTEAISTPPASGSLPATTLPATEPVPTQTTPPAPGGSPAAPGIPGGSPATPARSIFGIELHAISEQGGLGLLTGAGGEWVRRNALLWSDVESQPGVRSWQNLARLEAELQAAGDQNMQTILIVRGTPFFARQVAGSACGPVAAEYFSAFADFLVDAVSRYSHPPYNVRYWEIGNEPDVDPGLVNGDSVYGCWGDQSDPYYGGGHYAEMLKIVYPRVKAANPQVQVLLGGLLLDCDPANPPETPPGSGKVKDCSSGRFLEGVLQGGGGAYFDAVSFHAYDYYGEGLGRYGNLNWFSTWNTTGPVVTAKTQFLAHLLARFGWGDKPLLNTEVALICASSPGVCASDAFALTKAYYAAQVNASALQSGVAANVWYSLQGWRDSGLVGSGNAPNLAYTAYAASLERLSGAVSAGSLRLEAGLMGVAYNRQGTAGWIIWAVDEGTHSMPLPETPTAAFDVFGEALAVPNPVEIGMAPVYLEWQP